MAILAVCGVLACLLPESATAQGSAMLAQSERSVFVPADHPRTTSLERNMEELTGTISVSVEDAALETVLHRIVGQTGLQLSFNRELVPSDLRVSLEMENVSVMDALWAALEGTGLQMQMSWTGHLILSPASESRMPAPTDILPLQLGSIAGVVVDAETGDPLPGVNVVIDGTTQGASTGPDGSYEIPGVTPGAYAVRASFIGYQSQVVEGVEVRADYVTELNFEMRPGAIDLEEVVVVGYGTRRKETLTGSVSAVTGEALEKMPAINTSNTLGGKLPGVVAVTTSGEPGADGSEIRIRGNHTLNNNSPLIVIDGVPNRSGGLDRLNPNDIESISILKDASAAIYGAQAANGVILVTTRRGAVGDPELSIDVNQGFNQPTRIPEMADAATYLTMLNEIDLYRDREPSYSEEEIEKYRTGADPWLYPDTDWYAEALKPLSRQSRADVSLSGGTDNLRYFLSLGGLTEDGYYRNSATRYNQYSFRSNIDGQVTDHLSLRFDVAGRLEDRNFPTQPANATFRMLMRGKPHLPAYWPNGMPGPDIEFGQNPVVTGTDVTGYDDDERYFLNSNLAVNFRVPGVEGLTVRGSAAFDQDFRSRKRWETPWSLYIWDYQTYDESGVPVLQEAQRGYSEPRLYQYHGEGFNMLLNLVTEYQGSAGPHNYGVLLGTERQKFRSSWFDAFRRYYISDQIDQLFAGGELQLDNNGSPGENGRAGQGARQNFFTRVNYDYRSKYLLEFVGRYDGSYIFPENKRYGFFPAVSAGWRISEEPFFDGVDLFQNLKLRASWGQTGNDRIDAYQFLASYGFGAGYVFGVDQEVPSLYQTRTPNPDVTWEVANQFDVGLDGTLLDGRLSFELDYFDYLRTDILHYRNASVPQTTGLSLPRENIGEVASHGFDGSITWRQQPSQDFFYDLTFSGGYADNEIQFWDEPPGAPEWQRSTGAPMNTGLYYRSLGVFETWEDVEAYPHWDGARPGDIIFEDVDGDGEITADDRVRIHATGTPTFTGGLTFAAQLRQFDVNVFLQGAAGAVQYIRTQSGEYGNFLQDFAEKRWTPENPNGEHPRTFNRQDEYWISQNNTYFLRETDYVRLKTLQVGYTLPEGLVSRVGAGDLRLYLSGFNLLTWDKLGLFDPEARDADGTYYLQKRVYNVGLSMQF